MARSESVHTEWNVRDTRPLTISSLGAAICLVAALLGGETRVAAASGPGLGVKIGTQRLEDPVDLQKTMKTRVELEISSARFYDDHLDLAVTLGGSSCGTLSEDRVDFIDGLPFEQLFTDKLYLLDLRLAARLYPLGDHSQIRPYVGAGLGYFWFFDRWENRYTQTFDDPYLPGALYTVVEEEKGTDTFAEGLFPFLTAGLTIPLGSNGELMFDFQYDFSKEDSGVNLGGPIYMVGARIRF